MYLFISGTDFDCNVIIIANTTYQKTDEGVYILSTDLECKAHQVYQQPDGECSIFFTASGRWVVSCLEENFCTNMVSIG